MDLLYISRRLQTGLTPSQHLKIPSKRNLTAPSMSCLAHRFIIFVDFRRGIQNPAYPGGDERPAAAYGGCARAGGLFDFVRGVVGAGATGVERVNASVGAREMYGRGGKARQ
jgi:hypothetical protein